MYNIDLSKINSILNTPVGIIGIIVGIIGIVGAIKSKKRKRFERIIAENLHILKRIINLASRTYECNFKGQSINEIANIMQETYMFNDDVNEIIKYGDYLCKIDDVISKHRLELPKLLIQKIESISSLFNFTYTTGSPDEYWSFELAAKVMECSFKNKQKFNNLIDDCLDLIL